MMTRDLLGRLVMAAAAASMLAGCAIGAPPGFSSGDSWSFPLVAPLESGPLVVPVTLDGKGPYLFVIDPDSRESSLDEAIASENQLYPRGYQELLASDDHLKKVAMAEVKRVEVGTLVVSNKVFRTHKVGSFAAYGRKIRGVLGADIIADSLIFSYDRDRGVGYLATQGHFTPPADAAHFSYLILPFKRGAGTPTSRHLVKARVNGTNEVWMHIDLSSPSALRDSKAAAAKLPRVPANAKLPDELGTFQQVDHAAIAAELTVGDAKASGIFLLPYDDRRWDIEDIDGALGTNFFEPFNLAANWDDKTVYLTPRSTTPESLSADRIGRWGSKVLSDCAELGCVTLTVVDNASGRPVPVGTGRATPAAPPTEAAPATPAPTAGADATAAPTPPIATAPGTPPPPGAPVPPPSGEPAAPAVAPAPLPQSVRLEIGRAPDALPLSYEVLIDAIDTAGNRLPRLIATLPAGISIVVLPNLDPSYIGASFRILDANPFPRDCDNSAGCVWQVVK